MQTAVEWLEKKFSDNEFDDCFYLATNQKWFEQAKEMEIRQIQDACTDVYNKVKGTEISDEEIEKYAKQNAFQYYEFISGAKWYREQLKQKQ